MAHIFCHIVLQLLAKNSSTNSHKNSINYIYDYNSVNHGVLF